LSLRRRETLGVNAAMPWARVIYIGCIVAHARDRRAGSQRVSAEARALFFEGALDLAQFFLNLAADFFDCAFGL
jgi:hypothetical protein